MQYVYMLRAGENHYKVGVATNIKNRVSGIQTSNPNKIRIVTTKLVDDAYKVEGQLHIKLQELKANGGTEWFVLSNNQAIELAISINELPDVDLRQAIKLRDILKIHETNQKRIEQKLRIVTDLALERLEAKKTKRQEAKVEKEPTEKTTDRELLQQAINVISMAAKASTSLLQRKLQIGYGRAARIMEQLEEQGIIGPMDGSRPRQLLLQVSEADDIAKSMVNDMMQISN